MSGTTGYSAGWNDGGSHSMAPNTNAMDPNTMPSSQAEAARQKSAAVMAALKAGDTAEADRLMGKQQQTGTSGIVPLQWVKNKFVSKDKKNKKGTDMEGLREGDDGASMMSGTTVGGDSYMGKDKDDGVIR